MIIKSIVIFAFIIIVSSLGYALYSLIKNKGQEPSEKTLKALTIRISVSVIIFIFVFIALATGLFKPEGIGKRIQMHRSIQTQPMGSPHK